MDSTASYWGLAIAGDGAGGAFLAFADDRASSIGLTGIYAQHIDAAGRTSWTSNGVPVTSEEGLNVLTDVVADGQGGLIACWQDQGAFHQHVQRVDASGQAMWAPGGVIVDPLGADARLMADGAGGVYIAWPANGLFAQHLDATGAATWPQPGVNVTNGEWFVLYPTIVSDGAGGIIVSWEDNRTPSYDWTPYVQRLAGDGTALWTAGGVATTTSIGTEFPRMVSDRHGGAIVVWNDYRDPLNVDVYAQRIGPDGMVAPGWPADGAPVTTAPKAQWYPIALDVLGGAIVTWGEDDRNGLSDVYVQRIRLDGRLGPPPGPAASLEIATADTPNLTTTSRGGVVDIAFAVAESARVRLEVFDVRGRLVATLLDEERAAGEQRVSWQSESRGVFTFVLTTPTSRATTRGVVGR